MIADDAANDLRFFLMERFPGSDVEVKPGFDEKGQLIYLEVLPQELIDEAYAREVLGPAVEQRELEPIPIYCGSDFLYSHLPAGVLSE